nr:ATPase [Bacteroidota bacterium]
MIIIADSGSTKTDWIILKEGKKVATITTQGFNPNYFPPSTLENQVEEIVSDIVPSTVKNIFFYGSGCSSQQSTEIVGSVLKKYFAHAIAEVNHDLYGAARALFGNGKGIASILGTGSSSCLFDNGKITDVVPSLGYLLADEGSGMQLGSLLLNAFFKRDLPQSIHKRFSDQYELDLGNFINDLYQQQKPNSKIASFVPFIVENIANPYLKDMVSKSFRSFFVENILKYHNYPDYHLGFAGSIAYLFRGILHEVARGYNMKVEKIVKNPVDELVKYHIGGSGMME